jgi:signal transduction histidine kinase
MPTSPAAVRRAEGSWGWAELVRQPAAASGAPPGLFRPQFRRAAFLWVCVTLPVVAVVAVFATTPGRYIVVYALVASGLYTTPALLHTWLAARRAPRPDDVVWWMWLAALVLMYGMGCGMILGVATGVRAGTVAGAAAVAVISLLLMGAVVTMVRSRSGGRAMSVDLVESLMSVIVIVAPLALVFGPRVLDAEAPWYAIPAAIAVPCSVFGVYWAALLYLRLAGDSGAIATIGVALAVLGLINSIGQTAQGITGFALPAVPLLVLQALCMCLLSFIPLYVPDRISPGLDRLPPQGQVRGAWLPAALVLVGLPVLLVTTLALHHTESWAMNYSLGVVVVLLVLAALRQLAAVRETRRLYHRLETVNDTRRELLAQVMQHSDDDRHRVAAQLHEQAVSAYASFVSFMQAGGLAASSVAAGRAPMAEASAIVRDGLGRQAESLRRLMLAVQPLQVDRPRSRSLDTTIRAYVDALYGDGGGPLPVVEVDDDLVLDWATETVVLRIVQEAVSNVWRHSRAGRLDVAIGTDGPAVVVRVRDDGAGFDPSAALFESGIGVMRSLAALSEGTVAIDSRPGGGTTVTARLGGPPEPEDGGADGPGPEAPRPILRLVRDGLASSVGEA